MNLDFIPRWWGSNEEFYTDGNMITFEFRKFVKGKKM